MKYLIVILFALSACSGGIKTLPSSTGMLSEVVFVVEDPLWEKHIKDIVLKTFGTPIEGLLQNELSFKLVQVNPSEFKSILKTHKNIIIIAENVLNSSKKDKWAKGQLVVQFEFKREDNKLITDLNRLKKVFEFREIKTLKKSISKSSQKEQEIKIKDLEARLDKSENKLKQEDKDQTQVHHHYHKEKENKDGAITLILCLFLGYLGVHRFYSGHIGIGVIQLLTGGGCGIWTLIDLIMIIAGSYKDADGNTVKF
jgi:TM2 domain-containing membrane protein YozV